MNSKLINSTCVCGSFRKAARITTQIYDNFLKPAGLKVTQYSMLSAIHRCGVVSINDLAGETLLERTTCTRNLKLLEKKSLIRIHSGDDKRMKMVALTEHGVERLVAATPLWEQAQSFIVAEVGEEEVAPLVEGVQRLMDTLQKV